MAHDEDDRTALRTVTLPPGAEFDLFDVGSCLASARSWALFCGFVPKGARKNVILGALRRFLATVPGDDAPPILLGPRRQPRHRLAVARALAHEIALWDEGDDPSLPMMVLGAACLECTSAELRERRRRL